MLQNRFALSCYLISWNKLWQVWVVMGLDCHVFLIRSLQWRQSSWFFSMLILAHNNVQDPRVRKLLCFKVYNNNNNNNNNVQLDLHIYTECRSQWPRSLRRGSAAARLLRLWVRIPPRAWMCCQVEVSATSWSLVQRSSTDCGPSLCVI